MSDEIQVNWDDIQESRGKLLPEGKYLCSLIDVETTTNRAGAPMWTLKFEVKEGAFKGRWIWDRLFFSQKALPRVKYVFSRLGIDTRGQMTLKPGALIGRPAIVEVVIEEYEKRDGSMDERNTVPFDGYTRALENLDKRGKAPAKQEKQAKNQAPTDFDFSDEDDAEKDPLDELAF